MFVRLHVCVCVAILLFVCVVACVSDWLRTCLCVRVAVCVCVCVLMCASVW